MKPTLLRPQVTRLGQCIRALLPSTDTCTRALWGSLAAAVGSLPAYGNPLGGKVVNGQATVSQQGNRLDINQTTNKAILEWQSFNIGKGEETRFNQPSSSAVALNRVLSNDPTQILGRLTANGQVFLINQNGILFGKDARVDVGGLIATTSNINNDRFLSGDYRFNQPSNNPDARIVNQGQIRAQPGGSVVLAGRQVSNEGTIQARLGRVVLAGADTYTVDFHGDSLLRFRVGAPVKQTGSDPKEALVSNSGTLSADGGIIEMTARAAEGVLERSINMDGVAQARSVGVKDGKIVLSGGEHGVVAVSGQLDASGTDNAEHGGTVKVLGEKIALYDGATVNASGATGGGDILVGGNYQGKGPEQNAQRLYVAPQATLRANATDKGDGGRVIAWSQELTHFAGNINAKGGRNGGDGGFAEVSGKKQLDYLGSVNLLAPQGKAGSLLLDPFDILIDGGEHGSVLNSADDVLFGDEPVTGLSRISVFDINDSQSDVTLQALHDVTINAPITIEKAGVGLTVQAGNDIILSDLAGFPNSFIRTNGGALTLEANSPDTPQIDIIGALPIGGASGVGKIVVKNDWDISTNGGSVMLSGTALNVDGLRIDTRVEDVSGGDVVFVGGADTRIAADVLGTRATSDLQITTGTGNIRLDGDVQSLNVGRFNLTLGGTLVDASNNVVQNGDLRLGDGGFFSVNNNGTLTLNGDVTSAATFDINSRGDVFVNGNVNSSIRIFEAGNVTIDGDITASGGTISLGSQGDTLHPPGSVGNVTFNGDINANQIDSNRLANLTINGDVDVNNATIEDADNVTFNGLFKAVSLSVFFREVFKTVENSLDILGNMQIGPPVDFNGLPQRAELSGRVAGRSGQDAALAVTAPPEMRNKPEYTINGCKIGVACAGIPTPTPTVSITPTPTITVTPTPTVVTPTPTTFVPTVTPTTPPPTATPTTFVPTVTPTTPPPTVTPTTFVPTVTPTTPPPTVTPTTFVPTVTPTTPPPTVTPTTFVPTATPTTPPPTVTPTTFVPTVTPTTPPPTATPTTFVPTVTPTTPPPTVTPTTFVPTVTPTTFVPTVTPTTAPPTVTPTTFVPTVTPTTTPPTATPTTFVPTVTPTTPPPTVTPTPTGDGEPDVPRLDQAISNAADPRPYQRPKQSLIDGTRDIEQKKLTDDDGKPLINIVRPHRPKEGKNNASRRGRGGTVPYVGTGKHAPPNDPATNNYPSFGNEELWDEGSDAKKPNATQGEAQ